MLVSTIGVIDAPEQVVCDAGVAVATGLPLMLSTTEVALYCIFQLKPVGKAGKLVVVNVPDIVVAVMMV